MPPLLRQRLDVVPLDQVVVEPGLKRAFGLLGRKLLANQRVHLVERFYPRQLMLFDLDDVKAVLGLDDRRNIAVLGILDRGENRIIEVSRREFAEFAALGFRIVVGILARQAAEVGTLLDRFFVHVAPRFESGRA